MAEAAALGRIPINGEVLRWARLRLDLEIDEAARKVNVKPSRVAAWEAGQGSPTVRQARTLASVYDRPFLEFLSKTLPAVPETDLVPDYRFHRGEDPRDSVGLKEVHRWAEELRLNALDLLAMLGEEVPRVPREVFSNVEEDPEDAAERARGAIGPTVALQTGLKSKDKVSFPDILRSSFEAAGILVLRQSGLHKLHTRGICLFATPLPIIVFGKEAPGAQAFTLCHELGHVALQQSAISGPPRFGARHGRKKVEGWCNRFSAAYLMPKSLVEADVGRPDVPHDSIAISRSPI